MAFNYLPRAHNQCIRTNKREGVELVIMHSCLHYKLVFNNLVTKFPCTLMRCTCTILCRRICLYSPSSVFVLNHTSPDDFQPLSLQEMHSELAANFQGAKVNITGKCVYLLIIPYSGYLSPGEQFRQFSPLASIGEKFIHEYFLMY